MFGKTLIAAAVLAVAAAGTATTASAHSPGYKRVVKTQQCIGGTKYMVRKVTRANGRRVVTKTRIGRCYTKRHHHAHNHRKAKRIVKRIFRKAFNH